MHLLQHDADHRAGQVRVQVLGLGLAEHDDQCPRPLEDLIGLLACTRQRSRLNSRAELETARHTQDKESLAADE